MTALFDNNPDAVSVVSGVPLFYGETGFSRWLEERSPSAPYFGLAAIGGARGRDRLEVQRRFENSGIIVEPVVHPEATVAASVRIGAGSQILARSVAAANVQIGRGCIVNHGAVVDHECVLADGVHIAPGATLCGCIVVGECAFVGAGATILPRVSLGSDCTIGAGAVVTKDVPAKAVVIGNPARIVRFE